jgi:hypothetical protein
VTLVLGDWVGDYWQVIAERFLGRPAEDLRALLSDALADSPPDHEALAAYIETEATRRTDRVQQQAETARRLAERAWEDG